MNGHARLALVFLLVALPDVAPAQSGRAMTIDDLYRLRRISDPQVSPDGKQVAYVVGAVDLEGNKSTSAIWLVELFGGTPRQLTSGVKSDRRPRWSPDGKRLLFESNRSGDYQLFVIDLAGGEARQATDIATGAANGVWSRDGKSLAFVSSLWPEYSAKPFAEANAANKKRREEAEKSPVKARVHSRLFFRHWDEWVEDKRLHVFVVAAPDGGARDASGPAAPRDATPGDRDSFPTSSTFASGDDLAFSPDGTHLVYTAPPAKDEAWSTNYDIWRIPLAGGEPECLTPANPAADGAPAFSNDGKLLAYRAQRRPGFEADRWELVVVPVDAGGGLQGKPRSVTADVDRSVDAFVWGGGAGQATLFYGAEAEGNAPVFRLDPANPQASNGWSLASRPGSFTSFSVSSDGGTLAGVESGIASPPRLFAFHGADARERAPEAAEGGPGPGPNDRLLAELNLARPESVTVPGAGGTPMQMFIVKPPGFDPAKKWPLAYLVHGGPQGAWLDAWSWRWNPAVWAAQGYVVALPNPRGSTGFGQKYVDEITGDWGGKCFDDLMAGVDHLEKLPYIDRGRIAAAGASFGGYMMNWFQGHTTRFQTLISHCGVYNLESMWGTTEELWFDEREHGDGEPPWVKRDGYERFSPHRFAASFKTPMLIIHNDLDFRVPVSEGLQLFTTLQRLGVPSRMVSFPDEGHWVLKPANSRRWHEEIFGWLSKYCPPGPR